MILEMGHKVRNTERSERKMKKWLSLTLVAILMALTFAGCANPATAQDMAAAADTETSSVSSDAADSTGVLSDNAESKETKILIAYFSRSGNTKQVADMIHEQLGGDLFRIESASPYSEDYDTVLNKAQEEQRNNARPNLTAYVDNMDDYDIVFVGYPVWWGDTPMAVLTFLEEYDFSGKTVIPFCTYGSGGSGRSFGSVESATSGATVLDGFSVRGSDANKAKDPVTEWLSGLGIFETSVQSLLPTETNASGKKGESDTPEEKGTLEVTNRSTPSSTLTPELKETNTIDEGTQNNIPAELTDPPIKEPSIQAGGETVKTINIQVGSKSFTVILYDNASTQALLAQMPLTLNMSELNGNEKYYYLIDNLPSNSQRVGSIRAGDLMLYGSDCLVLFYEGFSTSYSYTPLGYMEDDSGLAEALGQENVQVTFNY
jgi:flavodoxin